MEGAEMTTDSAQLEQADREYLLHPYTNAVRHMHDGPLIIDKGEGVWVHDLHGNRYLEALAGLWCVSLGFSEKRLVAAASDQMAKLPYYHVFASKSHQPAIELSERLVSMAPGAMDKVIYASSGSEANDTAIKLVWYYNNAIGRPLKKKIISRRRAYHGVTIGAASLTGLVANHEGFDLPLSGVIHAETPSLYLNGHQGETEEEFATRLASELEEQILREGPDTIAAFIAEPVMGAGGVIVPPAGYFEKIQRVLRRHDILMIADEVICGFGRGTMFGCERFAIEPDLLVVAKALTSGYQPLSAIIISGRISEAVAAASDRIGIFGHGYTYAAHPVAAAVALETLKIYEERDVISHVRRVGDHLQAGLADLADFSLVGEARGLGLIGALQLAKDKHSRQSYEASRGVGQKLASFAQQRGLIVRAIAGDIIAVSPPLIISQEEIDHLVARLGGALEDTATWLKQEA
jgi:4-aminobutyrate--pyruvate transaminase